MLYLLFFVIDLWDLAQIASFLTYLTDVEEGGETMFPYEVKRLLNSSNFQGKKLIISGYFRAIKIWTLGTIIEIVLA